MYVMLMLLCLLLALVPWILGRAAVKLLYEIRTGKGAGASKGFTGDLYPQDALLTGGFLVIGLAEAAHLMVAVLGRSVSDSAKVLGIGIAGATVLSVGILLICRALGIGRAKAGAAKEPGTSAGDAGELGAEEPGVSAGDAGELGAGEPDGGKHVAEATGKGEARFGDPGAGNFRARQAQKGPLSPREILGLALFGVFLGFQLGKILLRSEIYQAQDMTLETVVTLLHTGGYGVNPLTGRAYELGMPTRLKLLCLPTLYADLCVLFRVEPELLVWKVIPVVTLAAAYLAYSSLGRVLFPESREKRLWFLGLVAMVLTIGDYRYGMEGFGLLHGGFWGVTIRGAVLLPYLLSLCFRRKWILAAVAVLAECCMVWTTYGAGMGLALITAFLLVDFGAKRLMGRREAAL